MPVMIIVVSSANRNISDEIFECISLAKIEKSRGPRHEPCGTPKLFN